MPSSKSSSSASHHLAGIETRRAVLPEIDRGDRPRFVYYKLLLMTDDRDAVAATALTKCDTVTSMDLVYGHRLRPRVENELARILPDALRHDEAAAVAARHAEAVVGVEHVHEAQHRFRDGVRLQALDGWWGELNS